MKRRTGNGIRKIKFAVRSGLLFGLVAWEVISVRIGTSRISRLRLLMDWAINSERQMEIAISGAVYFDESTGCQFARPFVSVSSKWRGRWVQTCCCGGGSEIPEFQQNQVVQTFAVIWTKLKQRIIVLHEVSEPAIVRTNR